MTGPLHRPCRGSSRVWRRCRRIFNELTCVEVSAAIALIVVALAVEHLRTKLSVNRRQTVICQHVSDDACHDFRNRGQPGTRIIGLSLMTSVIGTDFVGFGLAVLMQPQEEQEPQAITAFAPLATCISFQGRVCRRADRTCRQRRGRRSFNSQDVVAVEFLHDVFEGLVILFTGSDHQCVVVGQRNHRKDDVFGQRMVGTNERFSTAGAFQAVEPDNRSTWFSFHRVGDVRCAVCTESEGSGCQRAEFKETAS